MEHKVDTFIRSINTSELSAMTGLLSENPQWTGPDDTAIFGSTAIVDWVQKFLNQNPGFRIYLTFRANIDKGTIACGYAFFPSINSGDVVQSVDLAVRIQFEDEKVNLIHFIADPTLFQLKDPNISSSNTDVSGIGGVFFKATDPKTLCAWYDRNLGTHFNKHTSCLFLWRDRKRPFKKALTTFAIFEEHTEYYLPSDKPFMLNFRVSKLNELLQKLKANGVEEIRATEQTDYGKFAWIMDPEGNKIELWEPIDQVLEDWENDNNSKS